MSLNNVSNNGTDKKISNNDNAVKLSVKQTEICLDESSDGNSESENELDSSLLNDFIFSKEYIKRQKKREKNKHKKLKQSQQPGSEPTENLTYAKALMVSETKDAHVPLRASKDTHKRQTSFSAEKSKLCDIYISALDKAHTKKDVNDHIVFPGIDPPKEIRLQT